MLIKQCFRNLCNSLQRSSGISASVNGITWSKIPNTEMKTGMSSPVYVPIRTLQNLWQDWKMAKDVKHRKIVKEYAQQRLLINSLRKNNILPKHIREMADAEIAALPKTSSYVAPHARCVITSRGRGKVNRWRLSRIVWRHLVDYNRMSGVMRAMW